MAFSILFYNFYFVFGCQGTAAVQGIFLSMLKCMDLHSSSQAFEKMYDLRTLIITYGSLFYKDNVKVHLSNGDLDYLPGELRYLHWESYPWEVLPSSFDPMNLVELDLSSSNIKQLWEGRTVRSYIKVYVSLF